MFKIQWGGFEPLYCLWVRHWQSTLHVGRQFRHVYGSFCVYLRIPARAIYTGNVHSYQYSLRVLLCTRRLIFQTEKAVSLV